MIAHRLTAPRRAAFVAALLSLTVATGCGSPEGDTTPTPDATSPATASSTSTPPSEPEAAPIEGTWSTAQLSEGDFRSALASHGVSDADADAFASQLGRTVDLTLEIDSGFWTLFSGMDDQPRTVTDRGSYELQGARVTVRPNSGGENIFRWKLGDDGLSLTFVQTTEPPYEGVSAEVYQRGFYTTSSFQKDPS